MQRLWRSKSKLTSSEHSSSESENLPVELAYLFLKKRRKKKCFKQQACLKWKHNSVPWAVFLN